MLLIGGNLAFFISKRQLSWNIIEIDYAFLLKVQYIFLGFFSEIEQSFCPLEPQCFFKLFNPLTLACSKLSTIAAGRSVTKPRRVDKYNT